VTKILLVEDHEELWDMMSRRLRRHGFDVVLAHDGQHALTQVDAEKPDLILLDMDLPIMDGWTVANTLRGGNPVGPVPIIALTAHAMAGDRAKALAAGCDDYHPKPVDFPKLLIQIDDALLKREEAEP
jgi:CheY-like chemotaxis protein